MLNDAHTRMTIRTTLERVGFAVDFIQDGAEALAACRQARPDALVVGSKLPKMDGFVFLFKLKGDGLARLIPTIVVAEASEAGRKQMAMSRGAKAFLVKPLKVRSLLEQVVKLTKGDTRKLDQQYDKQIAKLAEQAEQAENTDEQSPPEPTPGQPIRIAHKLVKRVQHRKSAGGVQPQGQRQELLQKLRAEVQRLKGLPYHSRLEVNLHPRLDDVDNAFRKLAMPYHPDRYKHHGSGARRLAQGIFMLLSDAKKSLRPQHEAPKPNKPKTPEPSDSWRDLPPKRDVQPRSRNSWTPAAIDLTDIPAPPESSQPQTATQDDGGADDTRASQTTNKPDDERSSGDRVASPDSSTSKQRTAALKALSEGRYRDAKNQISRLLDALDEDETDEELVLSDKLARGHLRWDEGFPTEAIALFEEALTIVPECPEALTAIVDLRDELDNRGRGLFSRLLGKK